MSHQNIANQKVELASVIYSLVIMAIAYHEFTFAMAIMVSYTLILFDVFLYTSKLFFFSKLIDCLDNSDEDDRHQCS